MIQKCTRNKSHSRLSWTTCEFFRVFTICAQRNIAVARRWTAHTTPTWLSRVTREFVTWYYIQVMWYYTWLSRDATYMSCDTTRDCSRDHIRWLRIMKYAIFENTQLLSRVNWKSLGLSRPSTGFLDSGLFQPSGRFLNRGFFRPSARFLGRHSRRRRLGWRWRHTHGREFRIRFAFLWRPFWLI